MLLIHDYASEQLSDQVKSEKVPVIVKDDWIKARPLADWPGQYYKEVQNLLTCFSAANLSDMQKQSLKDQLYWNQEVWMADDLCLLFVDALVKLEER